MTGHAADLDFPDCCAYCPHLESVSATCTHQLRQSLVWELDRDESCAVYSEQKTKAMRHLADSR
ncbi:MAG: hypothetical protein ABEH86_06925 [Haloarcula sp.]